MISYYAAFLLTLNNYIIMRKTLSLLAVLLLTAISAKGANVTGALIGATEPVITYQSVDAQNNPITLSEKIYYKKNQDVKFVVLNCHATITHDDGCPTGSAPQLEAVKYMISEGALVICPDYIGFGETRDVVHPYMCATLTARNILDGYLAAIKYVTTTGGRKLASNYYTINLGYSQGGAMALAFQKYLETEATAYEQNIVRLRGSVCGAGPYDQQILFDEYEKMSTLDYPIYLYYVLRGHNEVFGNTTMNGLELKDCFTTKFWNYCQTTLKAKMDAKDTKVDDINAALKSAGFKTFYSIINANYANRNSNVYRKIKGTLAESNLLADDGWMPSHPVVFYHEKTGKDIVVPFAVTEAAMNRFGFGISSPRNKCSYVDAVTDYKYTVSGVNSLWHSAVFREHLPSKYGRASYFSESAVMAIAVFTDNESYKFSQLDHRTFGARFYAQFLSLQLRPSATSTSNRVKAYDSTTAIESTVSESDDVQIYSLDGTLQENTRKGINIIKMKDGSVKKVMK